MVELACITLVDIGLGRGKGTWETNCFFDSSKGIGLQPIGAVSPVGMSDVGLPHMLRADNGYFLKDVLSGGEPGLSQRMC